MGHQIYLLLCTKMTNFPPSEMVSEITFSSINFSPLWLHTLKHLIKVETGRRTHNHAWTNKANSGFFFIKCGNCTKLLKTLQICVFFIRFSRSISWILDDTFKIGRCHFSKLSYHARSNFPQKPISGSCFRDQRYEANLF